MVTNNKAIGGNGGFPPLPEDIHQAGGTTINHINSPTLQPHQLPLTQKVTPYPIYTDNEGNTYDPRPNGWGHSLSQGTPNTVRLITKNSNSISTPKDTPNVKLCNAVRDLQKIDAAILAGQEPCIDFKQKGKIQEIKYSFMTKYRSSRTTTSCSACPAAVETYLPGGTMLTTLGRRCGRIVDSRSDAQGRWSWQKMLGKGGKIIMIISAYRVSQKSLSGPTTAYAQQYKMLLDKDNINPQPRTQFIKDLIPFLQQAIKRQELIILALDANEELLTEENPPPKPSITHLVQATGLQDVHSMQHKVMGDTSRRSNTKIDRVLISPDLQAAVKHSGFLPWNQIMESDHRTGFVDFDEIELFGENTENATNNATRQLSTN